MVKGVLAGLLIPSVRQNLRAKNGNRHHHHHHHRAATTAATSTVHSISITYPVSLTTLQVSGIHLRLVPKPRVADGAKASGDDSSSSSSGQRKTSKDAAANRNKHMKHINSASNAAAAADDDEDKEVRVNVIVKIQVRGDMGDVPVQEFVAAVVPLKYSSVVSSLSSSTEGSSSSSSSRKGKRGNSDDDATTGAAGGGNAAAAAIKAKYANSDGHLPFDKRKLNALRRELAEQQGGGGSVDAAAGGGGSTKAATSAAAAAAAVFAYSYAGPQWLSAAVGPAAFAHLDVRVQMEKIRIVIELQPLMERARRKRPRNADHGAGRKYGKPPADQLDCSLEVAVMGSVSSLVQ